MVMPGAQKKVLVTHKEMSVKRQDFTEYSLLSSWLMICRVWRHTSPHLGPNASSDPQNKQQMVLIYTYSTTKKHDPNL